MFRLRNSLFILNNLYLTKYRRVIPKKRPIPGLWTVIGQASRQAYGYLCSWGFYLRLSVIISLILLVIPFVWLFVTIRRKNHDKVLIKKYSGTK